MRKQLKKNLIEDIVWPPYRRWLEIKEDGIDEMVRAGMPLPTSVSEDADRRVFEEHAPNVAPFIEQSLQVPIFSNEAEARKMTLEHFVPPFLRTWLEPQWAIQKVIGVVPSSELEQLLGTKWWRDYTTDFILERFKPWSIYISFNDMADPTGSGRLYEGAYVTFDRQDGELRLVIQHMTRTGGGAIRRFTIPIPSRRGGAWWKLLRTTLTTVLTRHLLKVSMSRVTCVRSCATVARSLPVGFYRF